MMCRGTTSVTSLSLFLSWFSFRLTLNKYSLTASEPGFRPRHTMYLWMATAAKRVKQKMYPHKFSFLGLIAYYLEHLISSFWATSPLAKQQNPPPYLSELAGLLVTGLKREMRSKQRYSR